MSGSVYIRRRKLPSGEERYDVRFRRGGRGYRVEHAGTFRTQEDAEARSVAIRTSIARFRRPPDNRPKVVYFARLGHLIKIGISKDPDRRCRSINARLLRVEGDCDARARERELHQMFAAHRERGEWFRSSRELEAYLT